LRWREAYKLLSDSMLKKKMKGRCSEEKK